VRIAALLQYHLGGVDAAVNLGESRHEMSMTTGCRAMVLGDREASPVRLERQEHM
jgi:hypothetical protein